MNERYLLDTAVASLVAQGDPILTVKVSTARSVCVSEVVYGELFYGAYRFAHLHRRRAFPRPLRRFAADERSRWLGATSIRRARASRPCTPNWMPRHGPSNPTTSWIAALAQSARPYPADYSDGDFGRRAGLTWELV